MTEGIDDYIKKYITAVYVVWLLLQCCCLMTKGLYDATKIQKHQCGLVTMIKVDNNDDKEF